MHVLQSLHPTADHLLGQGFKNWRQNLVQQSIKIKDENAPKAAAAYVHGIVKF